MERGTVLWVGGAQWAGKTSVSRLLTIRHPLLLYAYDYHDARTHASRARAQPERYPHLSAWLAALERDADSVWTTPTPDQMAGAARRNFAERFEMALDDLRALPTGVPVLAEGWGLRPELVAPLLDDPRKAVFLVPTEEFRAHQLRSVARATGFNPDTPVTDPDRAQANRLARNVILSREVEEQCARLGLRVIRVDGGVGVEGVADEVEAHFRPFLPAWWY